MCVYVCVCVCMWSLCRHSFTMAPPRRCCYRHISLALIYILDALIDWYCCDYFVSNSLVGLLEAACAPMYTGRTGLHLAARHMATVRQVRYEFTSHAQVRYESDLRVTHSHEFTMATVHQVRYGFTNKNESRASHIRIWLARDSFSFVNQCMYTGRTDLHLAVRHSHTEYQCQSYLTCAWLIFIREPMYVYRTYRSASRRAT